LDANEQTRTTGTAMDYLIVSSPNLEGLASIVNERWVDGWRPQGGPFVVSKGLWIEPEDAKGKRVAQALIREEL